MIAGRNSGLWAALIQAFLNVVAAGYVVFSGVSHLSAPAVAFFAALNAFGLAIVGVVANASDPTTMGILGARPVSSGSSKIGTGS